MAKKRKTRKRARAPRVEPLEQLLNTGNPETYGRACWFLANRDTERRGAADVIELDV